MINPIITAKIFSELGNGSSLLPMAVKDTANTTGMTTASYITGKEVEGKDRLIDELGAEAIWLGGIPAFKKVIDLTVYKIAGHNPKVDIRLLKDPNIVKKAIEHAPSKEIGDSIQRAAKNIKVSKGLAMFKFIASTALTLASYWGLTVFRHQHTEKTIIKEFKKEEQAKQIKEEQFKGKIPVAFKSVSQQKSNNSGKNPSFGALNLGALNFASVKDFMFNPVKNMMIVDGGITSERLGESRNPQDFMGYAIKEGGFWLFMYYLSDEIQAHFERKAEKSNKPIDLDIRVLQDENFQKAFTNGTVQKDLKAFVTEGKTDAEIYESLFTQKDNLVVKMAKKSDIVKLVKGKDKIDTQQFIDIDAVKGIKKKIEKLVQAPKEKGMEDFFKNILKLKKASIVKGIGSSILALGFIVPGAMLAMRFANKDNKEFQVKKEIHEKLKKENNYIA